MSTAITTTRPVDRRDSNSASFATRWLQPFVEVVTATGELDASNCPGTRRLRVARCRSHATARAGSDRYRILRHRGLLRAAHVERALRRRRCRVGVGAKHRCQPTLADLRSRLQRCLSRQRCRQHCRSFRPISVGYCSWSRSLVSDFASSRDTCICEMPTRSAIWVWVNDSKNLSTSTVRSRSGRASSKGLNASRFSI